MESNNSATVLYGSEKGVIADVTDWLNASFNVESFDHVTTHDVYQALLGGNTDSNASLRQQVMHSVNDNCSDIVVVVSHYDEEHAVDDASFGHMQKTMSAVADWQTDASVIGLWVNEFGTIDMLMHHDQLKKSQLATAAEMLSAEGEESILAALEELDIPAAEPAQEMADQHFGTAHLDTMTAASFYNKVEQRNTEPMRKAA